MIQEAYCSYEIAKLLKEKGFSEPCFYYYKDKVLMFSPFLKGRNLGNYIPVVPVNVLA